MNKRNGKPFNTASDDPQILKVSATEIRQTFGAAFKKFAARKGIANLTYRQTYNGKH